MAEPLLGGEKLPGPVDGFALEIIAEAEVAQHLEERVVIGRAADVVDVAGPQAFLAGGGPGEIELHLAQKMILELVHSRRREQDRRIPTRNQTSLGRRVQPFDSKKARYFSRSSSVFMATRWILFDFRGRGARRGGQWQGRKPNMIVVVPAGRPDERAARVACADAPTRMPRASRPARIACEPRRPTRRKRRRLALAAVRLARGLSSAAGGCGSTATGPG